ncbi:MAG: helicase associated domain-containing protein [Paraclostridium sp.]
MKKINKTWDTWYSELKRYVEQEGTLPLCATVTHTGYALGSWINRQRQNYKNGILELDRKELLEAIPYWRWYFCKEQWGRGYSELKKYIEQEGKLPSTTTVTYTGYALGSWISRQKSDYKKGKLELNKKKRLEAIPGWCWDTQEEKWERGYSELKKYVEQEGKLPLFDTIILSGYTLGTWTRRQRALYTKEKLELDKKKRLEAIPYWSWASHEEQWDLVYSELKKYIEQEGKLPSSTTVTSTGYALGAWINTQKHSYKRKFLSLRRKELLEEIPGWRWDTQEEKWERGYSELKKYVEQEGKLPTYRVLTSDGYQLGSWVNRQRYDYKNGKLEADRKELLEAIPGWWWRSGTSFYT